MKTHTLVIKEEAKNEIADAYYWYENKQKELGERFLSALNHYFNAITRNPKQFPEKHKKMRQATIQDFPYIIIFEIENNDIVVFAVFNTKQDPDKWKQR